MIPVFVASADRFTAIEATIKATIERNASEPVDVRIIRPKWVGMQEHGPTGFRNVRYAVPQLAREAGYNHGIYLDIDMLVLADIAELWAYRRDGWVCLQDGSTEVSVVSADLELPDKSVLHTFNKWALKRLVDSQHLIPLCWNVEDRVESGMKLLHFTAIDQQPWFYDHPNKAAVEIWNQACR